VRYLSLEWIDALTDAVANSVEMAETARNHTVGFTQSVLGGPEGDVTYHLQIGDGRASFGPGPAFPEDVRFEQDWETAVAVATHTLNAQQAFITGRIRLTGDSQKLIDSTPVFAVLDAVFSTVREFTDYR
jgi:putative sterol carrier protein